MKIRYKYLIHDQLGKRFRTNHGWVTAKTKLHDGEKMVSFDDRKDADKLIGTGFVNCCSYCIAETHPLFKYC